MSRQGYVEYSSNNSGGRWWLSDENWHDLEKSGWVVQWAWLSNVFTDAGDYVREENGLPKLLPSDQVTNKHSFTKIEKGGRWLGALAKTAFRVGLPLRDAADEWQRITGCNPLDAGCPCCGEPHHFTEYDENGKWKASGPEATYSASWS